MNTFGRIFRVSVFGESHGEVVGVLVDGCPAGISLSDSDMLPDLGRRKSGQKGTTQRKETDIPLIKSGIFNGKTTGAPILVIFENKDTDSSAYEKIKDLPRPGHADFTAFRKFGGFNDYRGGGHFSGRLTAGIVAAGCIAKKILGQVRVEAKLVEAGSSKDVQGAVDSSLKSRDSVGGIVECTVTGLPVGLGEPFFDSVESLISHAMFSVPAIKGIEFGSGFALAKMKGSECSDSILDAKGRTGSNHEGGINGGITNGNPLSFRFAVKPTSSTALMKKTVDLKSGAQASISVEGRHDACVALRVPVIAEAMAAIVLADLMIIARKIPLTAKGGL